MSTKGRQTASFTYPRQLSQWHDEVHIAIGDQPPEAQLTEGLERELDATVELVCCEQANGVATLPLAGDAQVHWAEHQRVPDKRVVE